MTELDILGSSYYWTSTGVSDPYFVIQGTVSSSDICSLILAISVLRLKKSVSIAPKAPRPWPSYPSWLPSVGSPWWVAVNTSVLPRDGEDLLTVSSAMATLENARLCNPNAITISLWISNKSLQRIPGIPWCLCLRINIINHLLLQFQPISPLISPQLLAITWKWQRWCISHFAWSGILESHQPFSHSYLVILFVGKGIHFVFIQSFRCGVHFLRKDSCTLQMFLEIQKRKNAKTNRVNRSPLVTAGSR